MKRDSQLFDRIFSVGSNEDFESLALEVFRFQHSNNAVYREFCQQVLCRSGDDVDCLEKIPFLPIEVFKHREVRSFDGPAKRVFTSSGTTGSVLSKHYIADVSVAERSFRECFRLFYGNPSRYCILALLPGYLEREGSSLVHMARLLAEESGHPYSGFYLDDMDALAERMKVLMERGERILLLGVSFALLELAERYPMKLRNAIVMETGGMKGRRREMVREELHQLLCDAFGQERIHSEYGMTELLSQAYSRGKGLFASPPWMRVLIRDSNDPAELIGSTRGGGISVIDLANVYSCSFIATQDLGRICPQDRFEVAGRFDHSDVRGCNLMV